MNELTTRGVESRNKGYVAPAEGGWTDEHEQDIGYHNRYGSEEVEAHDHLAGVGYNGKPAAFRD